MLTRGLIFDLISERLYDCLFCLLDKIWPFICRIVCFVYLTKDGRSFVVSCIVNCFICEWYIWCEETDCQVVPGRKTHCSIILCTTHRCYLARLSIEVTSWHPVSYFLLAFCLSSVSSFFSTSDVACMFLVKRLPRNSVCVPCAWCTHGQADS